MERIRRIPSWLKPLSGAEVRYHPLVIVLAAAGLGIAVDRLLPVAAPWWWLASVVLLGAWLPAWRGQWQRLAAACLVGSIAALAAAWHHGWWHLYPGDELATFGRAEPQPVAVEAIALTGPRRLPSPGFNPLQAFQTGDRTRLEVAAVAIRDGSRWRGASGRAALVVDGHLLGVRAGDRLRVFGRLSIAREADNPGDLDFAEFARAERRLCTLRAGFPDCVTVLERGSRWTLRRWLDDLHRHGDQLLWRHVQERSGLAAALLLGAREQLGPEQTAAFIETNTVHILAISGMHIAILAGALFYALRLGLLPRKPALLAVGAATLVYAVLTGAQPSAVRATILVLMICAALYSGRPASALNAWAAGGLVVLALNPADLFRAGPQLSFLAVATMIWFGPAWLAWQQHDPLERLIAQARPWSQRALRWVGRWTWRAVLVTTAIWLVTLPLVMNRFHLASPAAIILTTLLIVPVAVALMSGFGVLVFGWLLPPLAALFGIVCDWSLGLTQALVGAGSRLPGSHFWVAGPPAWWVLGFYAVLGLWAAVPPLRRRPQASIVVLAGWVALAWMPPGTGRQLVDRPALEFTFLSMGHGCSVVVRLPDGKVLLYDAGRLGSPSAAARSVSSYLWLEQIGRLDAIVISHADIDHYNALPELLEQFPVDTVYVSPLMFREPAGGPGVLRAALGRSGARVIEVAAGEVIEVGENRSADGPVFRVLHPPTEGVPGNDNANSIVLAVEYQGKRLLLPGDLEGQGIEVLLGREAFDCDVLLAPHHGSVRSNPPGFAAWCRPEVVIISGGQAGNREAMAEAYRRQAEVFHTADDGAVRVVLRPGVVQVSRWKRGGWEPRTVNRTASSAAAE